MATLEEPRKKAVTNVKHHTFHLTEKDHSKYPRSAPPAFYYSVEIGGFAAIQAAFQEASGLEVSMETEPIAEAGLNAYSHRVPKRTSYNNLVLKRGLVTDDSAMVDWVRDSIQSGLNMRIKPKNITVNLLDPETGSPLKSWCFIDAYPVKWSVGPLNSTESALTIENIEFAYAFWTLT